jgi:hypothetical protein
MGKTVTAPLSRITILFQVNALPLDLDHTQSSTPRSRSIRSVMKQIIREEGVRSLWNGNLTAIIHRFPYSAINFASYEYLKKVMCTPSAGSNTTSSKQSLQRKDENPFMRFMAGAMAASISCISCYPLDLVKTRIMVGGGSTQAPSSSSKYGKIVGVVSDIVNSEGLLGLYRGLTVALFVSVPSLAISWTVYESVKDSILNSKTVVGKLLSRRPGPPINRTHSNSNISSSSSGNGDHGNTDTSGGASARVTLARVTLARQSKAEAGQAFGDNSNRNNSSRIPDRNSNNSDNDKESSTNDASSSRRIPSLTPMGSLLAGSVSGMAASAIMFPADLVRRRLQVMGLTLGGNSVPVPVETGTGSMKASGRPFSIVKQIVREQGVVGLYRGLLPEMLKVAPMVGVTFASYELALEVWR